MRKLFAITIALLFGLFTTGLHLDLHTCVMEISCGSMADEDDHACCQTESETPVSNSCCDDSHLDYHLHDGAFVPAQGNDQKTDLPSVEVSHVDQPDLLMVSEGYFILQEEIPDPGEPLYSLFECRKLDC